MENKFKTIDEQIDELKKKGIEFKNEENAKRILLREGYYNLTEEYEDIFLDLKKTTKEQEIYVKETYFEELYSIYKLDRDLRNLIFDYINLVEIHMRSYISYVFSEKYGYENYLKRENFVQGENHNKRLEKLFDDIERNKQRNFQDRNSNIKKYYEKNENLPLWVLIKTFTFGNLTNFYDLMKLEDKEEVANLFSINPYSLSQFMKILNIVRNICAHGDVLFNIKLDRKLYIQDCDYQNELGIEKIDNEYVAGMNDLLAVMIILKKMIDSSDFNKMFIKIEDLLSEVRKELDETSFKNLLKEMGFPKRYNLLDSLM